jgi:hypothetical protein
MDRALETDTEAREAFDEKLITLLLLRQAIVNRTEKEHVAVFEAARDSAQAELLWRLNRRTSNQDTWLLLERQLGEEAANKEVVRQLRLFADLAEKGFPGFPGVFSAKLLPVGCENPFADTFLNSIAVTLSYPWPG